MCIAVLLLFQGSLICHCTFLVARDGPSQPGTAKQQVGQKAGGRKVRATALGMAMLRVPYDIRKW